MLRSTDISLKGCALIASLFAESCLALLFLAFWLRIRVSVNANPINGVSGLVQQLFDLPS